MSGIVTLRPNATPYDGGVGKYPTGNTVHQNLSDNDDNSWVWVYTGIGVTEDYTTYALPGTQRVAACRFVWRIFQLNANFTGRYRFEAQGNLGGLVSTGSSVPNQGPTTYWMGWVAARPQGGEWVQADIDSLRIYMENDAASGTAPAIVEEYVDLDVRTQATASVTSPTAGQKVISQSPTISWNYNIQGDTFKDYQVKIFTAAVATGGGFNADTSSAVWDSGVIAGAASSIAVGATLAYGASYYAYVKVSSDFNGADWWSAWSNVQFYINSPPVVSAVATSPATPITTTNRPNITFTYTDPDAETSQYVQIKVFTQTITQQVGFDVNSTAGATWDPGAVSATIASGAAGSFQVGVGLTPNTNYIAYVRASEVGSGQRWSPWVASAAFVIQTAPGLAYDLPATPEVLSVTPDAGNQRAIISVQGRDNILTRNQASADTGNIGLEPDSNITAVTGIVRDSTTYLQGGGSWKMTPTANGTTMVARSTRTGANAVFPVTPLRTYTALGSAISSAVTSRNHNVAIRWYTAAMALISTSTGANVAHTNAAFVQAFVTDVAPATAAWAEVIYTVVTPSEAHFWDNLSFAPGSSQIWTRGGFVLELGTLTDNFDRADSASSLGSAQFGGAWTANKGTWGISGNRAYLATGTDQNIDHVATLAVGYLTDGFIQADMIFSAVRVSAGLVFRALDNQNTLLVRLNKQVSTDSIEIYKVAAGSWTQLAVVSPAGFALGTKYTVKVEFYGGQINVYINGIARLSYLMLAADHNTFGSYGKYGMVSSWSSGTAAYDDGGTRWDNFTAKLPVTQIAYVERSVDAGVTWTTLRSANGVAMPNQLGIYYDYEVAPFTLPQYRLKVVATETPAVTVTSAYSAVMALSSQIAITDWWLKDPTDPTLNMKIRVTKPFTFDRIEPQTAYTPLGRKTGIVVTDGQKGIKGTLSVATMLKADYDKLNALLANARTLLLSDVFGRQWYVKFGDAQKWALVHAVPALGETWPIRHMHEVDLPFVEVAAP